MAKDLLARGAFPNRDHVVQVPPGDVVVEDDVEQAIKSQHYEMAYYGTGHYGGAWPAGRISVAGGAMTRVLVFPVVPRSGMTGLEWRAWIDDGSPGGGATLRVRIVELAVNVDVVSPGAGPQHLGMPALNTFRAAVNREEIVTTIEVYLQDAGGGVDTVDLRSFFIWDRDIQSGATLP